MMKKNGFTLIEVVISLVILVAIGLVVGVGLNKVFDKNKNEDYDTLINKIVSSADAYLSGNTTLLNQLQTDRGYLVIKVADLIEEGLLDENLVNPQTGEKIGATSEEDFVKATLDASGIVRFDYPAETVTESYLETQNKIIDYNQSFACDQISSYASDWGTPALRLVNTDGTVNTSVSINEVILSATCNVDITRPGTYTITYTYKLPESSINKELNRSLIVSPSMNDIVTITATVSPTKVVINSPITVTVQGINRYGQTTNLSTADYSIDSVATNTASTFTRTVTYTRQNSDGSVPTTTFSYQVMDNVAQVISDDNNCTDQSDNSCYYIGPQTGNYVSYSNKTWRIFKLYPDNSIGLILNTSIGNYAFSNHTERWYCSPSSCCNSGYGLSSENTYYLLTQNPNGLLTFLNTYLTTLANYSTYLKNATYDLKGYGSSVNDTMTSRIGLLSYADYSKIANCSTFSCNSNYLNFGATWGLGTYYRKKVLSTSSVSVAGSSSFNRRAYPHYNTTLYVDGNGNVAEAIGAYSLYTTGGDTKVDNSGQKTGVRPVIVLNSNTKITGGTGTTSDPFRVG